MTPARRWSAGVLVVGGLAGLAGLVTCGSPPSHPDGGDPAATAPAPAPAPSTPDDPCEVPGNVCTWMGIPGTAMLSPSGQDRRKTGLYMVQDVAFAPDGSGFVADFNNHRVLRVAPDGVTTTLAGTGFPGDGPHAGGGSCTQGCDGLSTDLWHPGQVAVDPADPNRIVVAAWHNHRIDRVDVGASRLTWLAGTGDQGYSTDPQWMSYPSSIVAGEHGDWFFSDQANQVVRRLTADGKLELVAGTPRNPGYSGDGGPATEARIHGYDDWAGGPTSKITRSGSSLFLADTVNGVIRRIDLGTGIIERAAGQFVDGAPEGSLPGYSGDDGPAKDAVFRYPRAVAAGPNGELYIADTGNNCIRVVGTDGVIRRFAGKCGEKAGGFAGDEGPALSAKFLFPCGVSVDAAGNVYVADANNHVIRRIRAASSGG